MDIYQTEIDAMKEIVDTCVGIPLFTYEMQQNAPRPSGEYAAVKCTSSLNPGYDETRLVEDAEGNVIFKTVGIRVLTFIIVFSRNGDEYVKFDNSFYHPNVQRKLREHGFAALGKTTLDLSSLTLETNWEFRQAIKMQFNVKRESTSVVDEMAYASVDGIFFDGDRAIELKGK